MQARGEITVFLALVASLILSFLMALLASAGTASAKSRARGSADLAMDSVFSEFDRAILDRYDLFLIDGTYAGSSSVEERFRYYAERNAGAQRGTIFGGTSLEETKITGLQLATDRSGAEVRRQSYAYLKSAYGLTLLEKIPGMEEMLDKIEGESRTWREMEEENEHELAELEGAKNEARELLSDELAEELPEEDPLAQIDALRRMDLLQLVLGEEYAISEKAIALEGAVSHRSCAQGFGAAMEVSGNAALEKLAFVEYLRKKCVAAEGADMEEGVSELPHVLSYEIEYILFGRGSDRENLRMAIRRILLIREGINLAYLMADPQKQTEALALATTLVGVFGIPPLITAVKGAIILAWAFAESVLDVRRLLAGCKVTMTKTASTWKLPLEQLASFHLIPINEDDPDGMGYDLYLRLFLYVADANAMTMRFLDLLECNIKEQTGNATLRADALICGLHMTSTWGRWHGATYTFPTYYIYQ